MNSAPRRLDPLPELPFLQVRAPVSACHVRRPSSWGEGVFELARARRRPCPAGFIRSSLHSVFH